MFLLNLLPEDKPDILLVQEVLREGEAENDSVQGCSPAQSDREQNSDL